MCVCACVLFSSSTLRPRILVVVVVFEDAPLVEFMYLVFTRMPDGELP